MKIRSKLMLGFGSFITLVMLLTGMGINNFSTLSGDIDNLREEQYPKMMLAYQIRGEINNISGSMTSLMQANTKEGIESYIATINQSVKAASEQFSRLSDIQSSVEEKLIIERIVEHADDFITYKDQVVKLVRQGSKQEAIQLREKSGAAYEEDVVNNINQLADYEQETMQKALELSSSQNKSTLRWMSVITIGGLLLGLGIMLWNIAALSKGLGALRAMIFAFSDGRLDAYNRKHIHTNDEFGEIAQVFSRLADDLEHKTKREREHNRLNEQQTWLKSNVAHITTLMQEITELETLGQKVISEIAPIVGAVHGAFYVRTYRDRKLYLRRFGAYACTGDPQSKETIRYGEGLVGQCAVDRNKIILDKLPSDYMHVQSGLGGAEPQQLIVFPVQFENQTHAVMELAALHPFSALELELLEQLSYNIGIYLNHLFGRLQVEELLRESQTLAEELQTQSEELLSQQEELRRSNERLEEQAKALRESEEMLQRQQEELEQSNEELIRKTELLEIQMKYSEQKNEQIEKTKAVLERQTLQLALTSKYKSEFLTNMSHELRTPLNSLLILSQMLYDNRQGNLNEKQVEYAQTIYASGCDLLKLIDEVLDLSKIDAGKMNITPEILNIEQLLDPLINSFTPIAAQKSLKFDIRRAGDLPKHIFTDGHRLSQILKNLLSNAFKFTHRGSVALSLERKSDQVAFHVEDTGIGIAEEKKDIIFESFQQADGTTSRKYGGTGLGLSISRELARLLGGFIEVESEEGKGSRFTLLLPERFSQSELSAQEAAVAAEQYRETAAALEETVAAVVQPTLPVAGTAATNRQIYADEDRSDIQPYGPEKVFAGQRVLIVDDDIRNVFALSSVLESCGMEVKFAENGKEAVQMLTEQLEVHMVLMDIMMPEMDGYEAMRAIRGMSAYKKLPIIALTAKAMKEDRDKCIEAGASDYITKPIQNEQLLSLMRVWLYP